MLRQKFMKWMVPSVSSQGVLRWGFISAYISLIGAVMVYINAINVCAGSTPFRNAVWIADTPWRATESAHHATRIHGMRSMPYDYDSGRI